MSTRRTGLPKPVAACHAKNLHLMEYHTRTTFGISEEYLKWCEATNPGGLRQPNGGGCVSWHSHMLVSENLYKKSTEYMVVYSNTDKTKILFQ